MTIKAFIRKCGDKPADSNMVMEIKGRFYHVENVELLEGPAVILHGAPVTRTYTRSDQLPLFTHRNASITVG